MFLEQYDRVAFLYGTAPYKKVVHELHYHHAVPRPINDDDIAYVEVLLRQRFLRAPARVVPSLDFTFASSVRLKGYEAGTSSR